MSRCFVVSKQAPRKQFVVAAILLKKQLFLGLNLPFHPVPHRVKERVFHGLFGRQPNRVVVHE